MIRQPDQLLQRMDSPKPEYVGSTPGTHEQAGRNEIYAKQDLTAVKGYTLISSSVTPHSLSGSQQRSAGT
jgi:hypothetical protein